MSARTRRTLKRSTVPLTWMALIFALSSVPGGKEVAWWEPTARTIGHAVEYAALTLLWSWALSEIVRRPVWVAAAIAFAYACTDEYHQSFVENRDSTVSDVAIDALGIGLAGFAISRSPYLQGRWLRRRERRAT